MVFYVLDSLVPVVVSVPVVDSVSVAVDSVSVAVEVAVVASEAEVLSESESDSLTVNCCD